MTKLKQHQEQRREELEQLQRLAATVAACGWWVRSPVLGVVEWGTKGKPVSFGRFRFEPNPRKASLFGELKNLKEVSQTETSPLFFGGGEGDGGGGGLRTS